MTTENDNKKQTPKKPIVKKEEKQRPAYESDDSINSHVSTTGSTGPRRPSKDSE